MTKKLSIDNIKRSSGGLKVQTGIKAGRKRPGRVK
jgi:hypothetical protein